MQKLNVTITLDVPKTKDLTPPKLELTAAVEMDADTDLERAKWAYFKSNYKKSLTQVLKAQVKHFDTPLKSMQAEIDEARKLVEELKGVTSLAERQKKQARLDKLFGGKGMEAQVQEYQDYLKGAVQNVEKQQLLVWHEKFTAEAEKAAAKKVKSDIRWKKARATFGFVLKGTLVIAAAALAVAASIATLGTVAPIFAALGVVSASIGGVTALAGVGKQLKEVWNQEKASLAKLESDLQEVAVHLGKSSSKIKGLPKHLDDASRFHTLRRTSIKEATAKIDGLEADLATAETEVRKLAVTNPDMVKKAQKEIAKMKKQRAEAVATIQRCMKYDEELNQLFQKARGLVGDLEKIDFTGSRSLTDSLARYKNMDSVLGAVDKLNAVAGGAAGLGGALNPT